jgi:hypothetical protein
MPAVEDHVGCHSGRDFVITGQKYYYVKMRERERRAWVKQMCLMSILIHTWFVTLLNSKIIDTCFFPSASLIQNTFLSYLLFVNVATGPDKPQGRQDKVLRAYEEKGAYDGQKLVKWSPQR